MEVDTVKMGCAGLVKSDGLTTMATEWIMAKAIERMEGVRTRWVLKRLTPGKNVEKWCGMNKQGLIIFDLDGTLIDSMEIHAAVFAQILSERFSIAKEISRRAYYRMSGNPLGYQFERAIQEEGFQSPAGMNEIVEDFYARIRLREPVLFADVAPALRQLWQAGYALVVCSGNAPDIVEKRLDQTGIKRYFTVWLGTDPAQGLRKGEPHFEILRQRLALSLEDFQHNAMSVGDAQHDIQVAKAAGILSVGRVNRFNAASLQDAQPDYLIADLSELVRLLKDLAGTKGELGEFSEIGRLNTRK